MVTDNFAIGFFMKTVRLVKKRIEDGQTRINDMSTKSLTANISNLDTTDIFVYLRRLEGEGFKEKVTIKKCGERKNGL